MPGGAISTGPAISAIQYIHCWKPVRNFLIFFPDNHITAGFTPVFPFIFRLLYRRVRVAILATYLIVSPLCQGYDEMHLITYRALREAAKKYPQHEAGLLELGAIVSKGYFKTPENLRRVFPSLDNFKYLDKYYVINVGFNELRLVALIFFESQKFYVRHVFTHREYDSFTAFHRKKGRTNGYC